MIYFSICRYDILEEDDCSQVEQLVFCDQRRMAHAAGEFLALRITRLSMEASPKKIKKGIRLYVKTPKKCGIPEQRFKF